MTLILKNIVVAEQQHCGIEFQSWSIAATQPPVIVFYHFKFFFVQNTMSRSLQTKATSCLTVVFLAYVKETWRVAPHGLVPSALWPTGISGMFLLGGQRQTDGRWAWSHFPSTPGARSPVSPALSQVPAVSCADTVELFCFEPTTVLLLEVGDLGLGGVNQSTKEQRSETE